MDKWNIRFLEMAELVALWSKDPSSKVGAVIVDDKKIVSTGYNGFAQYVKDTSERLNHRPTKLKAVLHAELNAILTAKCDLTGCTLICTHPPCVSCASAIIQVGITKVICKKPSAEFAERWSEDIKLTEEILKETLVELEYV